ncbi:MAG: hypothetical protein WCE79_01055 [Xanthobacteraceae bacterium]
MKPCRSAARADYAKSLVAQNPAAVRLNGAEFAALSGAEPEDAALARTARDTRAVMALTGTVDRITDGEARFFFWSFPQRSLRSNVALSPP